MMQSRDGFLRCSEATCVLKLGGLFLRQQCSVWELGDVTSGPVWFDQKARREGEWDGFLLASMSILSSSAVDGRVKRGTQPAMEKMNSGLARECAVRAS
jgi:hypothetical protein